MACPTSDSYHNATISCLPSGLDPQALTQPVVRPLQEFPTSELLFYAANTSTSASVTIFLASISWRACTCPLQVSSYELPHHVSVPLHFFWQRGSCHILSVGSHCSHSQSLKRFLRLYKPNPHLWCNFCTWCWPTGLAYRSPNPSLRSRKHHQGPHCPRAHLRALQPLLMSSGSPHAMSLVPTWMSRSNYVENVILRSDWM